MALAKKISSPKHFAALVFLSQAVPEDRGAAARSVYAARLVLGLVTHRLPPPYRSLAGEAYAVLVLLAVVGLASALLLMRLASRGQPIQVQPHSAVGGGKTVPET